MRITDVRTAEIKGHGYSTYVRIYTDEGIVGNGECIHGGEGCPEMVHALKQFLIGESPLNVDMLFEKMRRGKLFDGAMSGATVTMHVGVSCGPRPLSTSHRHWRHMPTDVMRLCQQNRGM